MPRGKSLVAQLASLSVSNKDVPGSNPLSTIVTIELSNKKNASNLDNLPLFKKMDYKVQVYIWEYKDMDCKKPLPRMGEMYRKKTS